MTQKPNKVLRSRASEAMNKESNKHKQEDNKHSDQQGHVVLLQQSVSHPCQVAPHDTRL